MALLSKKICNELQNCKIAKDNHMMLNEWMCPILTTTHNNKPSQNKTI